MNRLKLSAFELLLSFLRVREVGILILFDCDVKLMKTRRKKKGVLIPHSYWPCCAVDCCLRNIGRISQAKVSFLTGSSFLTSVSQELEFPSTPVAPASRLPHFSLYLSSPSWIYINFLPSSSRVPTESRRDAWARFFLLTSIHSYVHVRHTSFSWDPGSGDYGIVGFDFFFGRRETQNHCTFPSKPNDLKGTLLESMMRCLLYESD